MRMSLSMFDAYNSIQCNNTQVHVYEKETYVHVFTDYEVELKYHKIKIINKKPNITRWFPLYLHKSL